MIIYGWGRRTRKDEGLSRAYTCNNCRNASRFRLLTVKTWFTLFFVPLIPYSTKHFELCPVCSRGRELTKPELLALKQEGLQDQAYITGSAAQVAPPPVLDPGAGQTAPSQIQQ
jgi:hypothetical protein